MLGKGQQGLLRKGVDRVRSCQRFGIERVGCCEILAPGAGPEQALRPGAGQGQLAPAIGCEQLAIGLAALRRGRNTQPAVQLRLRYTVTNCPIMPASSCSRMWQ